MAGASPFDAVRARWANMEPSEVRPFVVWLQKRVMVEEIDIWRTAMIVVDQQGDRAPLYSSQRADELLEAGDLEGSAMWRRIKSAIEELQIVTPPD